MKSNAKRVAISILLIFAIGLCYFLWIATLERVTNPPWSPKMQMFLDMPGQVMVATGASFGGNAEDRPCNVGNTEKIAFKASNDAKKAIIYYCNKYNYNSIYYLYDILFDQREEDYILHSDVVPSGFEITSQSELISNNKSQDGQWKAWFALALMVVIAYFVNKKFKTKNKKAGNEKK